MNVLFTPQAILLLTTLQDVKVIAVWFRVDARPFKQALLTTVKRWSFLFKQHLIDHVSNRWAAREHSVC